MTGRPRHLNLRQIEAFKAVIEIGSISSAAQMIHISQPAMSKLIAHFEADTGLKLFDRVKGRLAPTESGMRLYEEVGRVFDGVRQIEKAAAAIRRQERSQLAVGVLPALSGDFIQRVLTSLLKERPNVLCSVQSIGSQWIVDWVIARKLDVGLVGAGFDNPYVVLEPLMEHPLVCIMPPEHPLATKKLVEPRDLDQLPFVSFPPDSYTGRDVAEMFEAHGVSPQIVFVSNVAPTVCAFVAAGLGVALMHPLMASTLGQRVVMRAFEPKILYRYLLCRSADNRNTQLVESFAQNLRVIAAQIFHSMLSES